MHSDTGFPLRFSPSGGSTDFNGSRVGGGLLVGGTGLVLGCLCRVLSGVGGVEKCRCWLNDGDFRVGEH